MRFLLYGVNSELINKIDTCSDINHFLCFLCVFHGTCIATNTLRGGSMIYRCDECGYTYFGVPSMEHEQYCQSEQSKIYVELLDILYGVES